MYSTTVSVTLLLIGLSGLRSRFGDELVEF